MKSTRRSFLANSAATIAAASFPLQVRGSDPSHIDLSLVVQYIGIREIVESAVNAAMNAGAKYADARFTFTQLINGRGPTPVRSESIGFGVRALYNGYWGFSAGPVSTEQEGDRLGRAAVLKAKINGNDSGRVEFVPPANASSGEWKMLVKDDPFLMSYDEIQDFMEGIRLYISTLPSVEGSWATADFVRQRKLFVSSAGQFTDQTLYRTSGNISFTVGDQHGKRVTTRIDSLTPAGRGFEHIRDQPLHKYIDELHATAMEDLKLPVNPVDPGRYNVLMDQIGVAQLLNGSIAAATELDRAMGYEANAGGTSYISDPVNMLGSFRIGNENVNISADRAAAGSVGRVKWDDDGVEPSKVTLVKNGVLVNMQTNNEASSWIRSYSEEQGMVSQSLGCSYAPDAIDFPLVHSADITLCPDKLSSHITTDSMRMAFGDGVEMKSPNVAMDFQCMTGFISTAAYEIKGGKRVAHLSGLGALFRTIELWTNLAETGGEEMAKSFGLSGSKGEPTQSSYHQVTAPAVIFNEVSCIDSRRKA